MKRFFKSVCQALSLLLVLCLVTGALSSCGGLIDMLPAGLRIRSLLEEANRKEEKTDSYTTDNTLCFRSADTKYVVKIDATQTVSGMTDGDLLTAERSTTTIERRHGLTVAGRFEVTSETGYQNGRMYTIRNNVGFVSDMTETDYRDYLRRLNEDQALDIPYGDAKHVSCTRRPGDAGWLIELSGLPKSAVTSLCAMLEMDDLLYSLSDLGDVTKQEFTADDVTVTIKLDADGSYESLMLDVSFASTGKERSDFPVFTMAVRYSNRGNTEVIQKSKSELYRCKEVCDLSLLLRAERAINTLCSAPDVDTVCTLTINKPGEALTGERRFHCQTQDDSFSFEITETSPDIRTTVSRYENGTLTTTVSQPDRDDRTTERKMTEFDARRYFSHAFDDLCFDLTALKSFTYNEEDDVYELVLPVGTMDHAVDVFNFHLGDLKIRNQTCTFKIKLDKDGEITSITRSSKITLSGKDLTLDETYPFGK